MSVVVDNAIWKLKRTIQFSKDAPTDRQHSMHVCVYEKVRKNYRATYNRLSAPSIGWTYELIYRHDSMMIIKYVHYQQFLYTHGICYFKNEKLKQTRFLTYNAYAILRVCHTVNFIYIYIHYNKYIKNKYVSYTNCPK